MNNSLFFTLLLSISFFLPIISAEKQISEEWTLVEWTPAQYLADQKTRLNKKKAEFHAIRVQYNLSEAQLPDEILFRMEDQARKDVIKEVCRQQ